MPADYSRITDEAGRLTGANELTLCTGGSFAANHEREQSVNNPFVSWLEQQQTAAVVTDADGSVVAANSLLATLVDGVDDDTTTSLVDLLEYDHKSSAYGVDQPDLKSLAVLPHAGTCHIRFRQVESLQVIMTPQIDATGTVTHRLWLLRDHSDYHRIQQHTEHSVKMQAISRFAGGMAHEFNNLLTAILGNLELLRANPEVRIGESSAGSRIESAEVAAMRASQLIHELRKFASRDAPARSCQSVVPVVKRVRKILSGIASDRIAVFHTFTDEPLLFGIISAESLEDALLKLGLNAVEAIGADDGQIHFDVSIDRDSHDSPQVTIVISDTGQPVSSAIAETAFEPFATRAPLESSGLGMAMAYGLTEEMGGTLRLQASDKGNEAILMLPLAAEASVGVTHGNDSSVTAPPRRLRVAVIEADVSIRRVARGMLRLLGHETFSFDDGNVFMEAVDGGKEFDLVLLSNVMQGMPGRRTYQNFRTRDADTPVVICSGRSVDLSSFAEDADVEPDAFLPKPFSIADLSAILAVFA